MRYIRMLFVLTSVSILIISCGTAAKTDNADPGTGGKTDETPRLEAELSSTTYCAKITTIGSTLYTFIYEYIAYSNSDALMICSISDPASQYSNVVYARSSNEAASKGSCVLRYDLDTANSGSWKFTVSPTKQAVYTDIGSSKDGQTVSFSDSDCTVK